MYNMSYKNSLNEEMSMKLNKLSLLLAVGFLTGVTLPTWANAVYHCPEAVRCTDQNNCQIIRNTDGLWQYDSANSNVPSGASLKYEIAIANYASTPYDGDFNAHCIYENPNNSNQYATLKAPSLTYDSSDQLWHCQGVCVYGGGSDDAAHAPFVKKPQ